jgi:hypothetical protein
LLRFLSRSLKAQTCASRNRAIGAMSERAYADP